MELRTLAICTSCSAGLGEARAPARSGSAQASALGRTGGGGGGRRMISQPQSPNIGPLWLEEGFFFLGGGLVFCIIIKGL